jgi:hypothetical protein
MALFGLAVVLVSPFRAWMVDRYGPRTPSSRSPPRARGSPPADRRGPVRARVQGLAGRCPVLAQPRDKLLRGHAVRTKGAAVGPDTPRRPAQILRREHLLPQRDLQAGDDSLPGARRPAATLSCAARRNSPSPPGSRPASAGWLRSPRPARATPDPPSHLTFDLTRLAHCVLLCREGAAAPGRGRGGARRCARSHRRPGRGTVEGYPEDAGSVPAGFLFSGALSTYEKLGFTRDRKIGKHRWVVARVVEPRT